jgi:hypothetical protein
MTVIVKGEGENAAADAALGKSVFEVLNKHYANHRWYVEANHFAGTVSIQLLYYDGKHWKISRYGVLLHIKNLVNHDTLVKKVIWAGGEMLERYDLPRTVAGEFAALNAAYNGLDKSGAIK